MNGYRRNGYVEISVAETNKRTSYERRWALNHKYVWEQKNGQFPKVCVSNASTGIARTPILQTGCLSRGALPFMNGRRGMEYDAAAPELRPAILALAKLKQVRSSKAKRKSEPERHQD
jgi:hypothetical protein